MVSKYSYKLATDTVRIEFKAYANSQLQSQVGVFFSHNVAVKYKICINYKNHTMEFNNLIIQSCIHMI